ncbi:fibrous sheath CABYR-binding protein-like [Macrobrachium rosenbergii]|uniref:fibrous sheath CABYR-binding protein-like n=1 Tax=Macrobrachium rosenbergii TaxID=79674 RepID=UPI0034D4037F
MLFVVVLAVVATIQVECAPNQLWPAFDKVSEQTSKKPIFATAINKEKPSKTFDPSATQHAHEQFIQTWLRQASIVLNRPEILNLAPSTAPVDVVDVAKPVIGEAVVAVPAEDSMSPAPALDLQVSAAEEFVPLNEEPLPAETSVATEGAAVDSIPEPTVMVFDPPVPAETVEYSPEAAEVVGDVSPLNEEILVPDAEQVPSSVPQEAVSSPVTEDVMITPVEEVAADPIPSLVEQDRATVLVDPSPIPSADAEFTQEIVADVAQIPLVNDQHTEILEPVSGSKPEPEFFPVSVSNKGKSFSSVQLTQIPVPSFAPAFPVARLPASRPDAVTTNGLAYTLQFFPTRGLSHYFISTPIGG